MKLSIHPLAELELTNGADWYTREATAELGQAFISEFERSVGLLREHPKLGAPFTDPLRRLPMRRFPYSIVYAVSDAAIRVVAIAHQRRKPEYWRGRN